MSDWSGNPQEHPHLVRVQHGGRRWVANWEIEGGRLIVDSGWACMSEPIRTDVDPGSRAAELLHAMVAGRSGRPERPVGF